MAATGRAALVHFALRQLDAAAEMALPPASQPGAPDAATAALGRLLQRCAALLESSDGALTEEMGGRAAQVALAKALRERCVSHGARLGTTFNSASGLKTLADDSSRRLQRVASMATSSGSAADAVDADSERAAQACEPPLDAMCALLRGVIQFDVYLKGRIEGGSGDGGGARGIGAGGSANRAEGESLRHSAPFSEMARSTVSLGHFWTLAAVSRAVRTAASSEATAVHVSDGDEVGGGDGTTSGLAEKVDSAFYVLQTSLRRAAHTCDGGIASAAVKHGAALLQRVVLAQLQGQLKQSLSSKLAGAMAGAALAGAQNLTQKITSSAAEGAMAEVTGRLADASRTPLGLLHTLSALDLCISYAPRLWRQAEEDFGRSLPPQALGATRAQLAEAESVTKLFEGAFDSGLRQLSSALFPRLNARLDAVRTASYTLQTEAAYAAAEGDTFVAGLMAELENVMLPLSPGLAEGAREALLQILIQSCADALEKLLFTKRFDQLGALQLDRDVRALAKRLGELTNRSVRERIARLTQMCTLLNLETEAESIELWSEGGWKLTSTEAKQTLALRIEFRTDAINKLPLS